MTAPVDGVGPPAAPAERAAGPGEREAGSGPWAGGQLGLTVTAAIVVAGVAFRLHTTSELWLDEALSVNIARLSPGDLVDALTRDGHPPLYYFLLHGWLSVFGDGNEAVRSLSAVFGIATLPLTYLVGRRLGGVRSGVAALLVMSASPFAVRYSTETRMYSLVMVLVLCGWLAIRACLDRPTPLRLGLVALAGGLLALTHYWSFYLLAAVALTLAWGWRRGFPHAGSTLLGLVASVVVFLPWLPTFLEQAGSTGTPWGRPERPTVVLMISLTDWGGGPNAEAQVLGIALLVLAGLALFGRALDRSHLEVDLRTRPGIRGEAWVAVLTVVLAILAGYATNSAFASRYTAVVFPLVAVIVGYGLSRLPAQAWLPALAVVLALSGIGDVRNVVTERTQAGELAGYIVDNGRPGDVVAFCPDQLGPAVDRLLPDDRVARTYPGGGDPAFIDWADYAAKQAAGDPSAFAKALVDQAGSGTVWLVWAPAYRTLGTRCEQLANALSLLRPVIGAVTSGGEFEHAALYQYGPGRG
jgi:mannosyltransferase